MINIANPGALTSPATDKDILLTTHFHSDHYSKLYVNSFPGQKLTVETGEIQLSDVSIRGIASAHNAADPLQSKAGTNYYRHHRHGLRIAHFGDIGQEALTPEQLETLGQVDVALTQFENSFSAMATYNMKGFKLMDQVKPRIIVQTHSSLNATGEAVKSGKLTLPNNPTSRSPGSNYQPRQALFSWETWRSPIRKTTNCPGSANRNCMQKELPENQAASFSNLTRKTFTLAPR